MTENQKLREALQCLYDAYCSQMRSEYDFPGSDWTPDRDNDEAAIAARQALALRPEKVPMTCHCHTCRPITMGDMRMVLCPKCGNKRCPHANDHRNDCTGSNEPGQPGSAYPAPHGITAKAKKE